MEKSQLALILGGAFMQPFGDQQPIESRWCELIDSELLAHRQMLYVDRELIVPYGGLVNPVAVILWNVAGVGEQKIPTAEQADHHARKVVRVGLLAESTPPIACSGYQSLPPPPIGSGYSPACVLRPEPGMRVLVAPRHELAVPCRVMVIPSTRR